ncbi:MAG: histidine phosphatase family protein [Ferruginibacter sp.]|nr:histidine phosphatase family protein [Ferruginibacter sp.]
MNDKKQKLPVTQEDGCKILLVVRHAKSSWDIGTLNDFERPLNDRGKKDAPMMAKRIIDKKLGVDAFVSSPAKRAKKTAELFCEAYNKPADSIGYVSMLYQATAEDFYEVVEHLDDSFNTVAVFSHNPGITEFVNTLTDIKIDNMPTCSIYALQVRLKKWADFKKAAKDFLFFDYPKLA